MRVCPSMRVNNDIVPFKNILNEMYTKVISKKVVWLYEDMAGGRSSEADFNLKPILEVEQATA